MTHRRSAWKSSNDAGGAGGPRRRLDRRRHARLRRRRSGFACRAAHAARLPTGIWPSAIDLPWDCVEIFFGDERFVPPDHPDSNYRMVRETLLAGGIVQPRALLAMPTDGTPESCADAYEEDAAPAIWRLAFWIPAVPLFDLMLLGLGADGHTASLIPGQPVLDENAPLGGAGAAGPRRSAPHPHLSRAGIQPADLFLVAGADKADAVARVRAGDPTLPAGRLRPQGEVIWLARPGGGGRVASLRDRGLCRDRRLPQRRAGGPRRLDRLAVHAALRFRCLFRRPAGRAETWPLADRAAKAKARARSTGAIAATA